jgi:hypothetical protein
LATNGAYDVTFSATGAAAYQADLTGTLVPELYGGPAADLNDTGLPANFVPGDRTMGLAMEWSETIAANSSITVSSEIAISQAVPEPGTMILCGGAAAVVWLMCWRGRSARPARA